jgi:hypothetical protein
MPTNFIFMLTQNDQTVPNAIACAQEAIAGGITHIGFKDIGIDFHQMQALAQLLQNAQVTTYLEVVSLDAKSELTSAEMALQLKVDYLLGGTRPQLIAPLVRPHPVKYFPFVGSIHGHPSELRGTIPDITAQARKISGMDGVDGLDLLAYRFAGDVPGLIQQVHQASLKPIIVAGSIHNQARIEVVKKAGVQGFTVGTAAFENRFDDQEQGLKAQLGAILKAVHR